MKWKYFVYKVCFDGYSSKSWDDCFPTVTSEWCLSVCQRVSIYADVCPAPLLQDGNLSTVSARMTRANYVAGGVKGYVLLMVWRISERYCSLLVGRTIKVSIVIQGNRRVWARSHGNESGLSISSSLYWKVKPPIWTLGLISWRQFSTDYLFPLLFKGKKSSRL